MKWTWVRGCVMVRVLQIWMKGLLFMTAILFSVFMKRKKKEPSKKNVIKPCKVYWNSVCPTLSWKHHHYHRHLLLLQLHQNARRTPNVRSNHVPFSVAWWIRLLIGPKCWYVTCTSATMYRLQPIWPAVFPLPATVQAKSISISNFTRAQPPKIRTVSFLPAKIIRRAEFSDGWIYPCPLHKNMLGIFKASGPRSGFRRMSNAWDLPLLFVKWVGAITMAPNVVHIIIVLPNLIDISVSYKKRPLRKQVLIKVCYTRGFPNLKFYFFGGSTTHF